MTQERMRLIGCGILEKEISLLIKKNHWELDTYFLDSILHVNFQKLEKSLTNALTQYQEENIIVFYGCCHPRIDSILENAKTIRTKGQNCIDILLGYDLFFQELCQGAFFLLEDWAKRWEQALKIFKNEKIMKDIFQTDRKYLLCLRTPCSEDFTADAAKVEKDTGLPIRWMDVSLDHLECVLKETIKAKRKDSHV